MQEFDLIAKYFVPLASGALAALGLKDDAAVISPRAGQQLVITKDAMIAGVHFIGDESPADIARKLLRVNLSDLAAMGATPYGYFLALMLPAGTDEQWIASFAQGLKSDQALYGVTLLGGDTTKTTGPLSLSLTLLGYVPEGKALTRSQAKVGDDIYMSGTLGDAALGLQVAQGKLSLAEPQQAFLLSRYRLPQPRLALGEALRNIAHSCMDISDGLMQDLGHICSASNVGAIIEWPALPISDAAKSLSADKDFMQIILAGGDDYELLFMASPDKASELQLLASQTQTPITRIGKITHELRVMAVDAHAKEVILTRTGYSHF